MQRDFKGIWIPKEIWLDENLGVLDKVILMEIDSLDVDENGCYASNEYLAKFCQCTETKVSTSISKLVKLGYLEIIKFDGRKRYVKSRLKNFKRQTLKNLKADFKKIKDINIINNKNNNNNMNIIINNWDKYETCDEINTTNNKKCQRRSTYNINGKNYCNQHSKEIIKKILLTDDNINKPTIDEIKEYCKERNNDVNAEKFYDFYESKGWLVGKVKMKDWKACVRTWEKNNKTENKVPVWFDKEIKREGDEYDELAKQYTRGYLDP